MTAIETQSLSLGYDQHTIIDQLDLVLPKGKISVLVGANGCGKSTLLKALAKLLNPSVGRIMLDGKNIAKYGSKELARHLSMLPQSPNAQETLTVYELVSMGRYPHQNWLKQWSESDERAVNNALAKTHMLDLKDKDISSLSGGQRQRAWIAMTIAQQTDVILLDEPTTYLDLAHQIDILDLLLDINKQGKTIVMVLHDLNLACRYADCIVAIADRTVMAQGRPHDVIDAQSVKRIFGLDCLIMDDPIYHTPLCIPYSKPR